MERSQNIARMPRDQVPRRTLEDQIFAMQQSTNQLTDMVEMINERPRQRWSTFELMKGIPLRTLRYWQVHKEGFRKCLVRKGRRLFIDLDKFDVWMASGRQ